jgi:4-hydroxy-3-methylbut-2-enyl diphosphate reductase
VDGADDVRPEWLQGANTIGVTAGASAPESLVQGVIARLREAGAESVSEVDGIPESMEFALPKELRIQVRD